MSLGELVYQTACNKNCSKQLIHVLSEETARSTVYHHFSQLFVVIQLSGLIKFREVSGVKVQLTQAIFDHWARITRVHGINEADSDDFPFTGLYCQLSPLS